MQTDQEFIERRIVTGLIVSPEFAERIRQIWNPAFLDSDELRTVADWCIEYYDEYDTVPDSHIQDIYFYHLRQEDLSKATALYIETLLESLSDEFGRGKQFNSAYLFDQTVTYFKEQELNQHNRNIQQLLEYGDITAAEELAMSYSPTVVEDVDVGLELSSEDAQERIKRAFVETHQPVVSYPGALGDMLNHHLTRGAFVTFLAPEKRGKSFWLLEVGLRAVRQKANVALFEAGDMTESQVLRRIAIYIAQRSDNHKNCLPRFRAVGDCVYNQLDMCTRTDRNCDFGIFATDLAGYYDSITSYINLNNLTQKYRENPDYAPCDSHTCTERRGTVWVEYVPETRPITGDAAAQSVNQFFSRYKRQFRLASFPAGTLTVSEISRCLSNWERHDGFVPDIVIVDYADLLSASDSQVSEFRHRQDHVWKKLRGLSQERHVLILSATQADAASYSQNTLTLANFSEDKRKLAHVTAQFGLNQGTDGRERALGIMRINEIVVREGPHTVGGQVTVLQDLNVGRAFLESYK